MQLLEFQAIALKRILGNLTTAENYRVILESPTGSGKTNIALKLVDEMRNATSEDIVFIWIAPGTGFLHKQSFNRAKNSLNNVTPNIVEGDISYFESDNIYFVNWEKINKVNNKYNMTSGDSVTWDSAISKARLSSKIFLIIDEEHLAHSDKSNEIISKISPDYLLRLSATPKDDLGAVKVIIKEREVIDAGLIRNEIIINDNLNDGDEFGDEIAIKYGIEKQKHLSKIYVKEGFDITPLLLVQIPSGNEDKYLEEVKKMITKLGVSESKIAIWLSDEKINLDSIDEMNVLIFKNAIATGWDYPRAQILVKLRDMGSKAFHIQTIGRIRRNIGGRPFVNSELNKGYLFTIDEKLKEEAKNHFNGKEVIYSILKKKYSNVKLPKAIFKKYNMDNYEDLVRIALAEKAIEAKKEKFTQSMSMDKITIKGTEKALTTVKTKQNIDAQQVKRDFWRSVSNLATSTKRLNYANLNSILKTLFHESSNGLIFKLNTYDYYKFIVNNEKILNSFLVDFVKEASEIIFQDSVQSKLPSIEKTMVTNDYTLAKKSFYDNYPIDRHESLVEKKFISKVDDSIIFDAWMKNTASIDSPLNIVYKTSNEYKNFKPDFILLKDEKIVVCEVKGESDIDKNTKFKYDAAKEFFNKNNIDFILVREYNNELVYWSGEIYNDDLSKYKYLGDYDEK